MSRPTLIDERDGVCEICAEWKTKPESSDNASSHFCCECKAEIPQMLNMQGNGFLSPKPNHFHLRPVLGVNGREALHSELCADCYIAAFKEAYPGSPLPASIVIHARKKIENVSTTLSTAK